jgi:GT2 family glycosyltransferase
LKLSIIIVNWNSGPLLRLCLDSIRRAPDVQAMGANCEVAIVDNASTDDSLADIGNEVVLVRNERNLGFGMACNQGVAATRGEYLLFLNPDCELQPGSVQRCLDAFESSAGASLGVCSVALADHSGEVARTCHRTPTAAMLLGRATGLFRLLPRLNSEMAEWDHRNDADVDHVIGAFYLMRRDLFVALGGFDERFFVYLEDLDLSTRVRRAGYAIRFFAQPPTVHIGGGTSRSVKARRLFYATRSRILYAFKHCSAPQAWLHLALTLVMEPLVRLALAMASASWSSVRETAQGFAMLLRDLPATVRLARRR